MMEHNKIVVFESKTIRRIWHEEEWYFSVVDVVAALTDSLNPRDYWFKMKMRVQSEGDVQLSTFCRQLKLGSSDKKKYVTDCANTKGMFRIIQSIPSPKAEPFKQWLAQVGCPGKRIASIAGEINRPPKTIERWIKKLRDEGKIKFRGSRKTGGYYVTGKE
jgi:prophage antirepressor-like protein